jgi:hypothetical protein
MIRPVLALGLLIALCASASAAAVHRSKLPAGRLHPGQHVAVPEHYTVPGWTEEQTRKWMTNPQVTD